MGTFGAVSQVEMLEIVGCHNFLERYLMGHLKANAHIYRTLAYQFYPP